mmetsp:Transcript_11189/g.20203  ORF Transcript_11189/g.20203 Transcript_11189/m.20203 type:complete len:299 (-) Transcript_11189:1080-1976(-)
MASCGFVVGASLSQRGGCGVSSSVNGQKLSTVQSVNRKRCMLRMGREQSSVNQTSTENSDEIIVFDEEIAARMGRIARLTVDSDELRELRMTYKLVSAQLNRAIEEERYMDAARARDRLAELRARDPLMRHEDLSAQLKSALQAENYRLCASLRDEIREVQVRLPQYMLQGKWGGVYGASGVQHIEIRVEDSELIAEKITGDSNVPAGQLTFKADVSFDGMIEPPKAGSKPDPIATALSQFANLKVKQRFMGSGQVANPGFTRPHWVPGELIVFEEDVIAFVWKSLSFMVVFERVDEQ